MDPVFELKNFKTGYGGQPVISVRNFTFSRGEVYALLGPNGSGKTTLLKSLAGLQKPTGGAILLNGEKMYGATEKAPAKTRRLVTFVAQTPVLFDASVVYNVAYGLKIRGISKEKAYRRALEKIKTVGLGELSGRNAMSLSGGEKQRAAIARALAFEPQILLLDEPTGNVDLENTAIIEDIIRKTAADSGTTVIFATHSGRQARKLARLAVHIHEGSLSIESSENPAGYLWDTQRNSP